MRTTHFQLRVVGGLKIGTGDIAWVCAQAKTLLPRYPCFIRDHMGHQVEVSADRDGTLRLIPAGAVEPEWAAAVRNFLSIPIKESTP